MLNGLDHVYWYPQSTWDTYTDFTGFTPYIQANSSNVKFKVRRKDQDRQTAMSAGNNSNISGASGLYCRFSISYKCA